MKTYSEFYKEINAQEMYDKMIQYGIFSEKLPPIFDSKDFLNYCKDESNQSFAEKWYPYVNYDSIRNINTPRSIGIPNPMGYALLCNVLKKYWKNIQDYFEKMTENQKYIVSRVHIRKMHDNNALFEMNYKNWETDGSPEPDILMGKRYLVKADVSQCFPSIYSHAISWALVTKEVAKTNSTKKNKWYNELDRFVRNMKNGETHGLLIGPHTSNILSEIVLCAVDNKLCEKWQYVRSIDDFACYTKSKDDAEQFIIELNTALKAYGLSMNHKKTQILELPVGAVENWVRQIQARSIYLQKFHDYVDYIEAQTFLDFCIELMSANKENASILLYGMKILKEFNLTPNARNYVAKTIVSLSLLYPYIVPLLDDNIFEKLGISNTDKTNYINLIYNNYINKGFAEPLSYTIYYATKYNIKIDNFDVNALKEKNDCILLLCALIYARHFRLNESLNILCKVANEITANDEMNEYWPFTYECLSSEDIHNNNKSNNSRINDNWLKLKDKNISFLKEEFR